MCIYSCFRSLKRACIMHQFEISVCCIQHRLCTTILRSTNRNTDIDQSRSLKYRATTESIRVPRLTVDLWCMVDFQTISKRLNEAFLTKMSPNEERIPPTICSKTETDCNVTLKKNRLANGETVKNHETTTQKNDDSVIKTEYVPRLKWLDLSAQIFIHAGCLYGLYLVLTQAKLLTTLWGRRISWSVCIYMCV